MNKTIIVNIKGDYPSCPLRSDLNTCKATDESQINDCPHLEDDDTYSVPAYCPLLSGSVIISAKIA